MGGKGSGQYPREKSHQRTVDGFLQLDAQDLWNRGALAPGTFFKVIWGDAQRKPRASVGIENVSEGFQLIYTASDDQESASQCTFIRIETTPCHYGGQRWWFRCPGDDCGRRVRLLYGDWDFRCRQCQQLNYRSQYEPRWKRLRQKAQDIRLKLGGPRNLFAPFPERPKGMHWWTYSKLWKKEIAAAEISLSAMVKSLHTGG